MVGANASRGGAVVWVERVLWAVAAAALLGLAGAALPSGPHSTSSPSFSVGRSDATPSGKSKSAAPITQRVLRTKPIESIRVGERVLGENPDRAQVDPDELEPDPKTWVRLDVRMTKPSGRQLEATLL